MNIKNNEGIIVSISQWSERGPNVWAYSVSIGSGTASSMFPHTKLEQQLATMTQHDWRLVVTLLYNI